MSLPAILKNANDVQKAEESFKELKEEIQTHIISQTELAEQMSDLDADQVQTLIDQYERAGPWHDEQNYLVMYEVSFNGYSGWFTSEIAGVLTVRKMFSAVFHNLIEKENIKLKKHVLIGTNLFMDQLKLNKQKVVHQVERGSARVEESEQDTDEEDDLEDILPSFRKQTSV